VNFRLSRQLSTGDEIVTQRCGTPTYAAPEAIRVGGYRHRINR
jgi:hypothetical protein